MGEQGREKKYIAHKTDDQREVEIVCHGMSKDALIAIRRSLADIYVAGKPCKVGGEIDKFYRQHMESPKKSLGYLSPSFYCFHADLIFAYKVYQLSKEALAASDKEQLKSIVDQLCGKGKLIEQYLEQRKKELEVDEEDWFKNVESQNNELQKYKKEFEERNN